MVKQPSLASASSFAVNIDFADSVVVSLVYICCTKGFVMKT